MDNKLIIKPISWSLLNISNANITIQLYGMTDKNESIYLNIPTRTTYIFKFSETVDNNTIANLIEFLDSTQVKPSFIDKNIISIRAINKSLDLLFDDSIEVKLDPYGPLQSLWEFKEIGPYECLILNKFTPIPGKVTNCDFNLLVEEDDFEHFDDYFDISLTNFFWDIETFSHKKFQFPNANNIEDFIFMISIVTENSEFILTTSDIKDSKFNIIHNRSEKDLLNKFLTLINSLNPQRMIYYNGDSFDMPYLIKRLQMNNINVKTIGHVCSSTHSLIYNDTLLLPSLETIDLLHYYRRFYPYMSNHKLDTVAKKFLNRNKVDLSIEDMMEAVRNNDINMLKEVAKYSYIDSFLLKELYDEIELEKVCNNIGINIDTLLCKSFNDIVDILAFNIDISSVLLTGKTSEPTHLQAGNVGIYQNIYIYDYSELYRNLMINSGNHLASLIGLRLEDAPPKLIFTAFYSKYVDRDNLSIELIDYLNTIITNNTIISIDATTIRSATPIDNLKLITLAQHYVSLSNSSYIVVNDDIELFGVAKLARVPFELMKDVMRDYFLDEIDIPDLNTIEKSKLYLTETLTNIVDNTSIKYKLFLQHGKEDIVPVKYLMIENKGPVLLANVLDTDLIDSTYYIKEINTRIEMLNQLTNYQ